MMTGAEFKAWREAQNVPQAKAATLAGISRKTVVRAEAATAESIPPKLEAITHLEVFADGPPAVVPDQINSPRAVVARVKREAPAVIPKTLAAAMLRNPPYATTGAEAKAMRHLRAQQRNVSVSVIRLLSLRPDWRRLESGRLVNSAIPDPLDIEPPAWAGARGVVTASGRVFDYEAAHEMRELRGQNAASVTAGQW